MAVAKKREVVITMNEVVDYSRLMGTLMPALRGVVERKFTADAAKGRGVKISNQELQRGADTFRHANGLGSAEATEEWMTRQGISLSVFEEFVETSLLVSKFKDQLERRTDRAKYLGHPQVRELVRELIYREWLARNLQ